MRNFYSETTPPQPPVGKSHPLLRLTIFVIVGIAFAIVSGISLHNKIDADSVPDKTYYPEYTISGITLYQDHADVTICLSTDVINAYLDELKTTSKKDYELSDIVLPSGYNLRLVFSKSDLQQLAADLTAQNCTSVGIHYHITADKPTEFNGTNAFVLFPSDLAHIAATMIQENLDSYELATSIEGQKFYISLEEAVVYLGIITEYGNQSVVIIPTPVNIDKISNL